MILTISLPARAAVLSLSLQSLQLVQAAPDSLVSFDGRRTSVERATVTRRHLVAADTVTLDVTYLRLPASTPNPGSPIVFLMGGPGVPASIIGRVPPYFTLFEHLRATADVILLDQRGVGLSQPSLTCGPASPPPPTFLASTGELVGALAATYAPCAGALRARGVPPELFGVREIADDIEAIRVQLGRPRISLLGFSYGTRLALEYAARYPTRVDLIALQGVLGFDHGARLPTALDSLLDRVSALAARDSVARSLVTDLRAAVADRLSELAKQPVTVPVPHVPGDTVRVTVGADGLRALITGQLADPRLPAMLAALDRNDTRVVAQMIAPVYGDLAGGGGSLFGRAVYCSAPPSRSREALARRLAAGAVLGEIFDNVTVSAAFCRSIGITPGAPAHPPDHLGGRGLLIEGTLDDRTPVGNADEMAPLFAEAAIITVEHGGHELLPAQEVQAIVSDFFAGESIQSATIRWPAPRFMDTEQALQPRRRPGG